MDMTITIDIAVYGGESRSVRIRDVSQLLALTESSDVRNKLAEVWRAMEPRSRSAVLLGVDSIARALSAAAERLLRDVERTSEVVAEVAADSSGVGAVASVYYAATGRGVPRAADEGGTYHGARAWLWAAEEAEERAARAAAGRTIRRVGFAAQS